MEENRAFYNLQILGIFVLRTGEPTTFEAKLCRANFHYLKYFATKLCNTTNFKTPFSAPMEDFARFVWIKF